MTENSKELAVENAGELRETYAFQFTKQELSEITNLIFKKQLALLISLILEIWLVAEALTYKNYYLLGFVLIIFFTKVPKIKKLILSRKEWKEREDNIPQIQYTYEFFDNMFRLLRYKDGEKIEELKFKYADIQYMKDIGKYMFLGTSNNSFIIRKQDLSVDSLIYGLYSNYKASVIPKKVTGILGTVAWILCIASYLSIFVAMCINGSYIENGTLYMENIWGFILCMPIPIASIIMAIYLKSKGYRYIKNLSAGVVMSILLSQIYAQILILM